jgi:hypothetical protein
VKHRFYAQFVAAQGQLTDSMLSINPSSSFSSASPLLLGKILYFVHRTFPSKPEHLALQGLRRRCHPRRIFDT